MAKTTLTVLLAFCHFRDPAKEMLLLHAANVIYGNTWKKGCIEGSTFLIRIRCAEAA